MDAKELKANVFKEVDGIKNGPLPLRTYMEVCIRCGTCAKVCPVYYGKDTKEMNPVMRSDLIRDIYKKRNTLAGKVFGGPEPDFTEADIQKWSKEFYECTGCRRCAQFCPFSIDNSVITRKGRGIVDKMGYTPETMQKVVDISLKTGNTDGASPEALRAAVEFLEEEMEDEHGEKIKIPLDQEGVDYFYVPPSGDVLVNPEATMGVAKVFHVLGMSDKWTMSSHYFDGANYGLFTGNDANMKADNKGYVEEAKKFGAKIMLMGECGHAYRIMKMIMEKAKWWGDMPFSIINCMVWTADLIRAGKLQFDKSKNQTPVVYHDPCNFAKSCNIYDAPREILKATCMDFREMYPNKSNNWCCGGGGGLSAMDSIIDFRMNISGKKKIEQIRESGANYVAAACSNCKRQLGQLADFMKEKYSYELAVGGVHDMLSRSILINGKAAERTEI